jgi:hypothetical protein
LRDRFGTRGCPPILPFGWQASIFCPAPSIWWRWRRPAGRKWSRRRRSISRWERRWSSIGWRGTSLLYPPRIVGSPRPGTPSATTSCGTSAPVHRGAHGRNAQDVCPFQAAGLAPPKLPSGGLLAAAARRARVPGPAGSRHALGGAGGRPEARRLRGPRAG